MENTPLKNLNEIARKEIFEKNEGEKEEKSDKSRAKIFDKIAEIKQ